MDQAISDKIAELASDLTNAEEHSVNESEYQTTSLSHSVTFTETTRDEKITEFIEAFRHTLDIMSQRDEVIIIQPLVCENGDLENSEIKDLKSGETSLKGTIVYAQKKSPRARK